MLTFTQITSCFSAPPTAIRTKIRPRSLIFSVHSFIISHAASYTSTTTTLRYSSSHRIIQYFSSTSAPVQLLRTHTGHSGHSRLFQTSDRPHHRLHNRLAAPHQLTRSRLQCALKEAIPFHRKVFQLTQRPPTASSRPLRIPDAAPHAPDPPMMSRRRPVTQTTPLFPLFLPPMFQEATHPTPATSLTSQHPSYPLPLAAANIAPSAPPRSTSSFSLCLAETPTCATVHSFSNPYPWSSYPTRRQCHDHQQFNLTAPFPLSTHFSLAAVPASPYPRQQFRHLSIANSRFFFCHPLTPHNIPGELLTPHGIIQLGIPHL